jgi:hypothetical protein
VREDQTRQRRGREEVELEQRPQLLVGGLLHGPDLGSAGIVDEHVKAAEPLERLGHGRLTLIRDRDIERQRVSTVRQAAERVGAARTGGDRVTSVEGGLDDRAAEAARGARHQPDSGVAAVRQGRRSS